MIDYRKLVPFKVDCKNKEYCMLLQVLLLKQGFKWFEGETYPLYYSNYLIVDRLFKIGSFNFNECDDFSYYKEIPIEKLLISTLKVFLKKKKSVAKL